MKARWKNARPPAQDPLNELPVPVRAVPEPESKRRITRRHTRRLHMARMGEKHLPWKGQHVDEPRCSGCGTEMTNETIGCEQCWMRHDRRRKRAEAAAAA